MLVLSKDLSSFLVHQRGYEAKIASMDLQELKKLLFLGFAKLLLFLCFFVLPILRMLKVDKGGHILESGADNLVALEQGEVMLSADSTDTALENSARGTCSSWSSRSCWSFP